MSICLALSFTDWILRASLHPSPALVDVGEVLLRVAHPPRESCPPGQDLMLAELCVSAAPGSSGPPCLVSKPAAIKAALDWGQGVFFGSPCGKEHAGELEGFARPSRGFANEPLPVPHISSQTQNETTEVHGEAFLLLQRQQKCSHANVSGFSSILEPKVASCLLFSG